MGGSTAVGGGRGKKYYKQQQESWRNIIIGSVHEGVLHGFTIT